MKKRKEKKNRRSDWAHPNCIWAKTYIVLRQVHRYPTQFDTPKLINWPSNLSPLHLIRGVPISSSSFYLYINWEIFFILFFLTLYKFELVYPLHHQWILFLFPIYIADLFFQVGGKYGKDWNTKHKLDKRWYARWWGPLRGYIFTQVKDFWGEACHVSCTWEGPHEVFNGMLSCTASCSLSLNFFLFNFSVH